jgi:glycosyltransferase involved in cell wall biosynthesis
MVVLSVIVPVYGVEKYLRPCLDSLLGDGPAGIEVIAVNDASPDGCAAILAEYAERDPRLRVVTLAENGGLGNARNIGLDLATGEYVWFVDSDDWLPDGTLAAVVDRVIRTSPDVLVVDYVRSYPDGHETLHSAADLFADPPGQSVFTLRERPELVRSLHIACNKVVRRDFLFKLGIRFGPGWYEDVSFSIPLILAADRIGVLDRACYMYRQRLDGAITRTVTDRHFEIFPHWEKVFDFLDERPGLADLRPLVFNRMMWHLLEVLGKPDRVPVGHRRAYFAETTKMYRRHRPRTGFRVPAGPLGHKQRLVARGAYATYEVARTLERTRRQVRAFLSRTRSRDAR